MLGPSVSKFRLCTSVAFYLCLLCSNVSGKCIFSLTNQTLENICDWSDWLPWYCTRCHSYDHGDYGAAIRQRGICCNSNQTIDVCKTDCGYDAADDTEVGDCVTSCPEKTSPSSQFISVTQSSRRANLLPHPTNQPIQASSGSVLTLVGILGGIVLTVGLVATGCICLMMNRKRKKASRVEPDTGAPTAAEAESRKRNIESW